MKKYLISGFNTVQDVKLEAGTYTLVAYAKSMYSNVYTFALGDGENWTEYDIDVVQGQLCKVWLTFTIDKKATKFKPIANNFSESLPVYVTDLQLTKGNIPVEAGASPFDIDQILNDLHDEIDAIEDFTEGAFLDGLLSREEKTQLRASLDSIGAIVESVKGSYDKLLDNPFISDATMNDITEKYYALIASWISDGDPRGLKPVILWIVNGDNIVSQNEREEKDRALNAFNDALYAYNQAEKEVYSDVGENSIAPIITEDGFWAFWDSELQEFVKSEFSSIGDDAHSPYVDPLTGTWWEWNPTSTPPAYRDTGIKAEGKDGKGILEVKDFYGLSSSETTEPTEWLSYIPNKPADKYLWNYEKIIYTDGTSTDTKKRVIQGKDARSIESVVNAYAYSASDTISPTGGWMRSIASLGVKPDGYFLWVRDDITYTDGTSSSTSGYVVKDGADGKEGAGTETIYILGNTYPSTPSGNNPSGWVKFPLTPTKSQKYVYVSTRSKPEGGVWGAWSSPAVYTIFIEALDAAVPAVSYMDGEWAIGRTFIRDDYSFPLVTYLKGTGDRPLFYYLNKKGTYVASSIADSPKNNSSGANPLWRYVENVDMLISDSVFTGMLKLSDSNFLETAGGSGHTGVMGTLPALWAGGTYNEAKRLMNLLDAIRYGGNPVGKTANFVVNHSGAAKLGIFVIDQSGRVNFIDPVSGKSFGSISNYPIPLYSDMILNVFSESSAMNSGRTFWYNDNNILLPNSLSTVRAGGEMEFTATATFSGSIPAIGSAYVELILRRNGVYFQTLYIDFFENRKLAVHTDGTPSLNFTNTVEISEKLTDVPNGMYDILFKSEYIMASNSCKLQLSDSSLYWTYNPKDSKSVQIGNNGFMAWFGADKHIHLSETEGLKIKGIPADAVTGAVTTAFARVASNAAMSGSTSYLRAGLSLHSSKSSKGKYRLSHNLNKLKYVCHVTPTQAARSASIILQDSYYIDIEFRNEMGDLSDSSFSFSIIELNN